MNINEILDIRTFLRKELNEPTLEVLPCPVCDEAYHICIDTLDRGYAIELVPTYDFDLDEYEGDLFYNKPIEIENVFYYIITIATFNIG